VTLYNLSMAPMRWARLVCVAVLAGSVLPLAAQTEGWTIPPTAASEQNPLAAGPDLVKKGKALFTSNCQRCHGPEGKGDGPEASAQAPPANLSDPSRAAENPDGVLFYKVWSGRAKTAMPAFKSRLTRDDVWAIVAHVKTLRN
jgi:mono/diheme cytochrome c family protein